MVKSGRGFSAVEIIIGVVVLAVIGIVIWRVLDANSGSKTDQNNSSVPTQAEDSPLPQLIWQQADGAWQATQTPPKCPDQPLMHAPVNMQAVTSVLYPGQTRGQYKPHGGFRFDGSDGKINVSAPLDGFVVRGSRYIEQDTVQYTFDIMNNCGVMYRFDHLAELSDTFKALADKFPPAQKDDSRTTNLSPAIYIKQDDLVATSIGFKNSSNFSVDWGVYDFRQSNEASKAKGYQNAHQQDKEAAWHAVCWFDWLPSQAESLVKSLPAGDANAGKSSDYCN